MNNTEELEVVQQSIVRLRADVSALRAALEAVMTGLPFQHQRQLLQHLEAEAVQLEQSFDHPAVPARAKALRSLAGTLEAWHIRQQEQQRGVYASQESAQAQPLRPPPSPAAS
jgi:hypothetical protein